MPKVSNIESFIELASELYSTYPTTTTLSITYTNISKKHNISKGSITKPKHAIATHSVNFKLYEPGSGKCIKFNTFKIKELSRILNFIGPRGVNDGGNSHVIGLASLMTNVKYDAVEEETTPAPEGTPEVGAGAGAGAGAGTGTGTGASTTAPSTTASKKKNKKKKKKN